MANSSNSSVLLIEGLTLASPGSTLSAFIIILLAYIFVLLSNLTVSLIILLNRSLHQPMYLLYLNLSVNDVLGNSCYIPRLLVDILRVPSLRTIHFYNCVIQSFFVHMTGTAGHAILMTMAFDRYVAICEPLRYSVIMTGRTVVRMVVWSWSVVFLLVAVLLALSLRLTRCRSQVYGLSCSNASLFKLSCQSTFINNVYGLFLTVVMFLSSMGSIALTYSKIMIVCLKRKNASLNRKALQTCSTHLLSYLILFFNGMMIIAFHRFPSLTQERKVISIVYQLLPSGLNPLIYGLQSSEVRRILSAFFRQKKSNAK